MSWPKAKISLLPARGMVQDLPPHDAPPDCWTLTHEAASRDGFCGTPAPTRAIYPTLPGDAQFILNAPQGSNNWWIAAYEDEIHAIAGTTTGEITPSGGLLASTPVDWSGCLLNGVPVLNSNQNPPMYWDGDIGGEFAALPDWPAGTLCKTMLAYRNFLIACDISAPAGDFPMQILWSDVAPAGTIPGSWTAGPTSFAGDAELSQTPGPVLTGAVLRGSLLLYKPTSIYAMDFTGDSFVFAIRPLLNGFGALTRKAVVEVGDGRHFVVGQGRICLYDGAALTDISSGRVARYLFDDIDPDNYGLLHCTHIPGDHRVRVAYPAAGASACTRYLDYDYVTDTWTAGSLPSVLHSAAGVVNDGEGSGLWDDATEVWDDALQKWGADTYQFSTQLLVEASSELIASGLGTQDKTTVLERMGLHFGQPERFKFIRRLHIRAEGTGTLQVRVGGQSVPDGPVTYGAAQPFVVGTDAWVNVSTMVRLVAVRIEGEGTWRVSGLELEGDLRGYV